MDQKHLDELIAVERSYWWHVAKRALVTELLRRHFPPPARLVERGVVVGANLLAFRAMGYRVSGFDVIPAVARVQQFFATRLLPERATHATIGRLGPDIAIEVRPSGRGRQRSSPRTQETRP
jgi:hypothetical protein